MSSRSVLSLQGLHVGTCFGALCISVGLYHNERSGTVQRGQVPILPNTAHRLDPCIHPHTCLQESICFTKQFVLSGSWSWHTGLQFLSRLF